MKRRIVAIQAAAVAMAAAIVAAAGTSARAAEEPGMAGGPVSADELGPYRAAVPPDLVGTPSLPPRGARHVSSPPAILYWQCNAWPVTGLGAPTYWISFSAAFSLYQALSACTAFNGVACYYNCFTALN
jgi:hypothetical protein